MTWTCWHVLSVFHNKLRASCVNRSVFCHLSTRPGPPAAQFLPKPPPSLRLRVLFFWCYVMSIYLWIDLSVHFSPGVLLLQLASIARIPLIYFYPTHKSSPIVYWLEEVLRPVAQRFGEWVSASRTFAAITDLIAVLQREVDLLFVLIFLSMNACSTS